MARFVEVSTGVEPSKKLVDAVHAETEGNPLFVGEVVRVLAAEGRLAEAPGVDWRLQVPAGVDDATTQRLRALSKDCRRVLTIASALGREFSTEVLENVSDMSEDEVLEGLDEGDRVVLSGQFLIDSEASLAGTLARLGMSDTAASPAMTTPSQYSADGTIKRVDGSTWEIDDFVRRLKKA